MWEPTEILEAMIEAQFSAVAAVRASRSAIERAGLAIARRLSGRGRLIYVGAGTPPAVWPSRAHADVQLAPGTTSAVDRGREGP